MRRKSKSRKTPAAEQPAYAAAQSVTGYCQAIVTLVPSFTTSNVPANVTTLLNGVVSDANTWMNGSCSTVTQTVPSQVVNFNAPFQSAISTIESAISALQQNPNNSGAKQQLTSTLTSLTSQVGSIGTAITSTQTQLTAYEQTLQSDSASIQTALNTVAQTTTNGQADIQSVQGTLSTTFFTSDFTSPCFVIVEVDFSISEQLSQILSSNPPVVPLVMTQTLLQNLVQSNASSTTAMSAMLDAWATLVTKYQAVAGDLQNASSQAAGSTLQLLAIQTAANDWSQLVDYAQQLQGSSN
jgi:Bacillus haemolytic enterotoxin (HBL)